MAVVAGGDRTFWGGNKDIALCDVDVATCRPLAIPPNTVGLVPGWLASGALVFSDASADGAFGPTGDADFSSTWMAQWDTTNLLWVLQPGATRPQRASSAGAGVVASVMASTGSELLLVRDDALWLLDLATATPPAEIAGPLFASIAPSDNHGQVDWQQAFAWSAAPSADAALASGSRTPRSSPCATATIRDGSMAIRCPLWLCVYRPRDRS